MASDIIDLTMVNDPDSDGQPPEFGLLSRRAVLSGLAAGTLGACAMTMVPHIPGSNLVPFFDVLGPETAYANGNEAKFTFDVVGSDQVGFQILDVSDVDPNEKDPKKGVPVKDAVVTLTRRFSEPVENPPYVTGTTDKDGKVKLSIASIAFDKDPKTGVLECNCSIEISTAKARVKMRDFSAGLVALAGASGVIIGTHKVDSTDVYLERCTFDDWDVHYSMKTFMRSIHNNIDHTILVHVKGVTADTNVDLVIIDSADKDKENPTPLVAKETAKAKYKADKGYAEASWTHKYLLVGDSCCITKNKVILRISYTVGGKTITNDIRMNVQNVPTDQVTLEGGLIPFTTDAGSIFSFSASNDWPCFNGASFSVLSPSFPLQVSTSLTSISIGIGTDARMKDDDGKPSATAWMKDHKGNIGARYDRMYKEQKQKYEGDTKKGEEEGQELMPIHEGDAEQGDEENKTVTQKNKFLKNFDFNIIARIVLNMAWHGLEDSDPKDSNEWAGAVTGELGFSAAGTLGLQSPTTPPFYVTATLSLTALFAYTAKVSYEQAGLGEPIDCKDLVYDFEHSWGIYLKIGLKISLGVGYKGVFSLSFDSSFGFPFWFGWGQDPSHTLPSPHITIGVTICLEVVFQCFLFRISGNIYSYSKPGWYNNWEGKGGDDAALTGEDAWGSLEPRFRLTHPDGTMRHSFTLANDGTLLQGNENPFEDMIPVTDDMMHAAREADAKKPKNELAAIDEAAEAARFIPVNGAEGVFKRDDGTVVFTNKIPRAYEKDDGSIGTELVDCEGVNTFFFDEDAEAMLAQAESEGTAAPLVAQGESAGFAGDPMLGFALGAMEEYDYDPVPGKTTGAYCGDLGIKSIAENDGVKPTVDAVIFKDVHSDPRQRVVEIGGVPYLFRVVTVSYPVGKETYCRSRVVASAYDSSTCTWGDPKVIEYNTGSAKMPRINTYDYDFDIVVRTGDDPWVRNAEACLVVVGGLRPADGETNDEYKVYDAFANPVISVVLINSDLRVVDRAVQNVSVFNDGKQHMLCSPCIVDGFGAGGAGGSLAYTFLHRSAPSAKGLTNTDSTVTFGIGQCYARNGALCMPPLTFKFSGELNKSTFGIKAVAGDPVKGSYDGLLTVLVPYDGGYDVWSATLPEGKAFDQLVIKHNIACSETLPEVQPWPHHGTFLFTKDRPGTDDPNQKDFHLYEGSYDVDKEKQKSFTAKQVDTLGMKGASFCVSPSGKFVFYNESHRDKPPEDDALVGEIAAAGFNAQEDGTVYRIMALRYDNGKFCEDFPFCELDHPIDHIELVKLGTEASSFVITEITDADKNLADMHYVSVPNVQAVEIESFASVEPFVYAGKNCAFQIDIRNHGNMIIGGMDVEMHDPARGNILVGKPQHIGQIEPKNIRMNATNLGWGDHAADVDEPVPTLTAEEQQGMLMPGKLMSYVVSFDIPQEWHDLKTVMLCISGIWSPPITLGEMTVAEEEQDVVYYLHEGTEGSLNVRGAEAADILYDPDETVTEDKPDNPVNPDKPDNPVNPVNPNNAGSGTTPKTGDPFGIAGAVGMALGGLGALLAGYSARRVRNERAQLEDEEE